MPPTPDEQIDLRFTHSLATTILADLTMLAAAETHEGLDPWIAATRAALGPDLAEDLSTFFAPFAEHLLVSCFLESDQPMADIQDVIRHISKIANERIDRSNLWCLRELTRKAGLEVGSVSIDTLRDPRAVGVLLQDLTACGVVQIKRSALLGQHLADPDAFKAQMVYLITRFWDRHAREEASSALEMESRSIRHFEHISFEGRSALEIFADVVGRPVPESVRLLFERSRRWIFVPSCHAGPYASVEIVGEDGDTMAVVYNCRPTAGEGHDSRLPTERLFAPLKALADETRLEILARLSGKESYAQQIVDQLRISQPAVSRHLRLLVSSGVLRERKQDGMKFYSIDERVLHNVGQLLESFRSVPTGEGSQVARTPGTSPVPEDVERTA